MRDGGVANRASFKTPREPRWERMLCLRPNPLGGKLFWCECHTAAVGTYYAGMPTSASAWPCTQNSAAVRLGGTLSSASESLQQDGLPNYETISKEDSGCSDGTGDWPSGSGFDTGPCDGGSSSGLGYLWLLIIVVLFSLLAFMVTRHLSGRIASEAATGEGVEQIHDETYAEGAAGAEIFEIMRDIPELEGDHEIWEERFGAALEKRLLDPESEVKAEELKARDEFAAGRLELLKRLEGGSSEERRNLLDAGGRPEEVLPE